MMADAVHAITFSLVLAETEQSGASLVGRQQLSSLFAG